MPGTNAFTQALVLGRLIRFKLDHCARIRSSAHGFQSVSTIPSYAGVHGSGHVLGAGFV
jgi:hypothetical protein